MGMIGKLFDTLAPSVLDDRSMRLQRQLEMSNAAIARLQAELQREREAHRLEKDAHNATWEHKARVIDAAAEARQHARDLRKALLVSNRKRRETAALYREALENGRRLYKACGFPPDIPFEDALRAIAIVFEVKGKVSISQEPI